MTNQNTNAILAELKTAIRSGGHISRNPEINVKMLVQLREMYTELHHALERIASGEPNPIQIASDALYGEDEAIDPN